MVYHEIQPRKKTFKVLIVKIIFWTLGRAIFSLSKFDTQFKAELQTWPSNTTIILFVLPHGPNLSLIYEDNQLKRKKVLEKDANLAIYIKNIEIAFLTLTAQMGTLDAFIQHRNLFRGDVPVAMSFIRCLNIVQSYLFPQFLVKRVIPRVPKIPRTRRYLGRIRVYLIGIPFGR